MRARIALVAAVAAVLAVPAGAAAHPMAQTNSLAFGAGGAAASLVTPPDDGGANFATTPNMRLLSFEDRQPRPPLNSFGGFISDLAFWGDTAYQGTFAGFRIIDIGDPRNPVELADYRDCQAANGAGQGDVVVWGSILVRSWDSNNAPPAGSPPQPPGVPRATCDGEEVPVGAPGETPALGGGFEGVHVFDVSDPGNPDLVASVDLACGSHTATGVPDLENGRLLVYSTPSSGACDGIDIVEVPLARPEESEALRFEFAGPNAAGADGFACHDTAVILGRAMKASCAGGNGFAVWSLGGRDGGSLDNPRFLYNKSLTAAHAVTVGHSAAFSWDGETIIFGHEPSGGVQPRCTKTGTVLNQSGTLVQTDDMKSFFFFDTDSGEELGKWTLPRDQTLQENCTLHNYNIVPTGRDDILVHGSYQSGIGVLDFSNPASAREIAFADPAPLPPQPTGANTLGGDWGTYFYNGLLYESDINRGLYTWKLSDRDVDSAARLRHLNPQTQEFTIGARKDHHRWNKDDLWRDDGDKGDD
jgi:LVIVD repeat